MKTARRSLSRRRPLLVLQACPGGVRAVVAEASKDGVTLTDALDTSVVDPHAALDDLMPRLGARVRNAVLVSADVVPSVLDLPIDPAQPRSDAQMQELVRWELEPRLLEHSLSCRVGQVLVARSRMTPDQVDTVLAEQTRRRAGSAAASRQHRFGEIAIDFAFVQPGDLDEALAIAEDSRMAAENWLVGWSGQGAGAEPGQHRWLLCGGSSERVERWRDALTDHGVALLEASPLDAMSVAAMNGTLPDRAGVVALRPSNWSHVTVDGGRVAGFESGERTSDGHELAASVSASSCASLLVDGDASDLDELRRVSHQDVHGVLASDAAPALVGAARHAWRMPGHEVGVAIDLRRAPTPWRKTRGFWCVLVALLLTAGVVAGEAWFAARIGALETELDEVRANEARLDAALDQARGADGELASSREGVKLMRTELAEVDARVDLLGTTVPARSQFLVELLDTMSAGVTSAVAIDHVREDEVGVWSLGGWALSEGAAQSFARSIAEAAAGWAVEVGPFDVQREAGRLGLEGYAFSLTLEPLAEVDR